MDLTAPIYYGLALIVFVLVLVYLVKIKKQKISKVILPTFVTTLTLAGGLAILFDLIFGVTFLSLDINALKYITGGLFVVLAIDGLSKIASTSSKVKQKKKR